MGWGTGPEVRSQARSGTLPGPDDWSLRTSTAETTVTDKMASGVEADVHATALRLLNDAEVRYVVAGAYALRHYTGIERYTKDVDLFLFRSDVPKALRVLKRAGYKTKVLAEHWLAHATKRGYVVDLIHGFGGWRAQIDQNWFDHSVPALLHDVPVQITPIEEMTWMKAYVAHRERFDGADVVHLLQAGRGRFDWRRFVGLFDDCWELLLFYLTLFQFVYPGERDAIPTWVMDDLLGRLRRREGDQTELARVTQGTLIDRFSFLPDVNLLGFEDGRLPYAIAQGYTAAHLEADRREAAAMVGERRVNPARVA